MLPKPVRRGVTEIVCFPPSRLLKVCVCVLIIVIVDQFYDRENYNQNNERDQMSSSFSVCVCGEGACAFVDERGEVKAPPLAAQKIEEPRKMIPDTMMNPKDSAPQETQMSASRFKKAKPWATFRLVIMCNLPAKARGSQLPCNIHAGRPVEGFGRDAGFQGREQ